MKWTRIDYVETKCKICHRKFKSTAGKHAVCPRCEYKDKHCMAIIGFGKRCIKKKLEGEFYCAEHLPKKDSNEDSLDF